MNRSTLVGLLLPLLLASCGGGAQDSTKPTVFLDTSLQGNTLIAKATATDNVAVKEVRFYVDNELVATDSIAPYESELQLQGGAHMVKVIAVDASGNESEPETQRITVNDVMPPTLELKGPQEVRGTTPVKFTVTASDNVGITRVVFYDGTKEIAELTQAPYVLTRSFTPADNGPRTYKAVAYDAAGNSAESSMTVNVNVSTDTVKPTLVLTVPEQGVTTAGDYVLGYSATDNVGIAKVEGQLISQTAAGTQTLPLSFKEANGSMPVTFTREMNGTYTLALTAYDAAGNADRQQAVFVVQIP